MCVYRVELRLAEDGQLETGTGYCPGGQLTRSTTTVLLHHPSHYLLNGNGHGSDIMVVSNAD